MDIASATAMKTTSHDSNTKPSNSTNTNTNSTLQDGLPSTVSKYLLRSRRQQKFKKTKSKWKQHQLHPEVLRLLDAWKYSIGPPPQPQPQPQLPRSPSSKTTDLDSKGHDQRPRGSGVIRFCIPENLPRIDNDSTCCCSSDDKNSIETTKSNTGSAVLTAMILLQDQIVRQLQEKNPAGAAGVPWGEATETIDPRRRMYGFLPGKRQELLTEGIRIERYNQWQTSTAIPKQTKTKKKRKRTRQEHDVTLSKACIDLAFSDCTSKEPVDPLSTTALTNETTNGLAETSSTVTNDPRLDDDCSNTTTTNNTSSTNNDNKQAVMTIEVSKSIQVALTQLTNHIQKLVPIKYKPFVTMDHLIAVQPNLHNGASHLPLHLDFPRNDGFGIVIATVAIRANHGSYIILVDDGDDDNDEQCSWSFPFDDGDCYVLTDHARNKCLHGVLVVSPELQRQRTTAASVEAAQKGGEDETNVGNYPVQETGLCYRETLNLRYGLHSTSFAESEIYRHWPD